MYIVEARACCLPRQYGPCNLGSRRRGEDASWLLVERQSLLAVCWHDEALELLLSGTGVLEGRGSAQLGR